VSYVVSVGYDTVERRYFVISSDISGLNIEAGTFEEFVEAARDAAPDLIADRTGESEIRFEREVILA
jgi:hypothetical protein